MQEQARICEQEMLENHLVHRGREARFLDRHVRHDRRQTPPPGEAVDPPLPRGRVAIQQTRALFRGAFELLLCHQIFEVSGYEILGVCKGESVRAGGEGR